MRTGLCSNLYCARCSERTLTSGPNRRLVPSLFRSRRLWHKTIDVGSSTQRKDRTFVRRLSHRLFLWYLVAIMYSYLDFGDDVERCKRTAILFSLCWLLELCSMRRRHCCQQQQRCDKNDVDYWRLQSHSCDENRKVNSAEREARIEAVQIKSSQKNGVSDEKQSQRWETW